MRKLSVSGQVLTVWGCPCTRCAGLAFWADGADYCQGLGIGEREREREGKKKREKKRYSLVSGGIRTFCIPKSGGTSYIKVHSRCCLTLGNISVGWIRMEGLVVNGELLRHPILPSPTCCLSARQKWSVSSTNVAVYLQDLGRHGQSRQQRKGLEMFFRRSLRHLFSAEMATGSLSV